MKKYFLSVIMAVISGAVWVVLAPGTVWATTGDAAAHAGGTTGEFLQLAAGARPAAMGEAYGATADDVNSLYWNPAGLAELKNSQVLLAHTVWYLDTSHEYAAYAQPLGEAGAFGISATYLTTTFEKRAGDTEDPDATGAVGDLAVGASYGRQLIWGIEGGATAKYINSKLDSYTASTLAFDLGLRRACPGYENLLVSLVATNLFGALKYVDDSVSLGSTLDFGLALKEAYFKNLHVALDLRTLADVSNFSANVGAEYVWSLTESFSLSPRLGLKSNGLEFSAGLGITWKGIGLDYAFVPQADLGNTQRISLQIAF